MEDVEGPSDAAADPEELAKDQEGGVEKDQSKWTGSVRAAPRPPTCLPWDPEAGQSESTRVLHVPRKIVGSVQQGEGFGVLLLLLF